MISTHTKHFCKKNGPSWPDLPEKKITILPDFYDRFQQLSQNTKMLSLFFYFKSVV